MSYRWQRASADQVIEVVRDQSLTFDSWVIITFDDPSHDAGGQPRTATWFSGPEEAVLFLESRMIPMWLGPQDEALKLEVVAHAEKLRSVRKFRIKDMEQWRKTFNQLMGSKGQILWFGPLDDLMRGEASSAAVADDMSFWFSENGVELTELDTDESRHQKLLKEFFVQLAA